MLRPKLLECPGSRLADVLRHGLCGLHSLLAQAHAEAPGDPGGAACSEFLEDLKRLLKGSPLATSSTIAQTGETPPVALSQETTLLFPDESGLSPPRAAEPVLPVSLASTGGTFHLGRLRESLASSPALRPYLGEMVFRSGTDSELWCEIQRLILRLPATLARKWRQQAAQLAQEAGPGKTLFRPTRIGALDSR